MPSFDVVSEVDVQEVRNAIDQAQRELATRFDFKGTDSTIEFKDNAIELESASEERLKAAAQVLEEKMVRRKVSLKALDYGKVEEATKGRARQTVVAPGRHQRREGARDRQVHQGSRAQGRAAPGAGRPAPRDRQEARRPADGDRSRCASTTSACRSTSRTSATRSPRLRQAEIVSRSSPNTISPPKCSRAMAIHSSAEPGAGRRDLVGQHERVHARRAPRSARPARPSSGSRSCRGSAASAPGCTRSSRNTVCT